MVLVVWGAVGLEGLGLGCRPGVFVCAMHVCVFCRSVGRFVPGTYLALKVPFEGAHTVVGGARLVGCLEVMVMVMVMDLMHTHVTHTPHAQRDTPPPT